MHRLLVSPEYGIQLDTGSVVIGPDWESPAEVIDSYHGFGTTRVYGHLVVRTREEPQWRPAAR